MVNESCCVGSLAGDAILLRCDDNHRDVLVVVGINVQLSRISSSPSSLLWLSLSSRYGVGYTTIVPPQVYKNLNPVERQLLVVTVDLLKLDSPTHSVYFHKRTPHKSTLVRECYLASPIFPMASRL